MFAIAYWLLKDKYCILPDYISIFHNSSIIVKKDLFSRRMPFFAVTKLENHLVFTVIAFLE
jgi:hypothetical protein